jgi:hypothetical protein
VENGLLRGILVFAVLAVGLSPIIILGMSIFIQSAIAAVVILFFVFGAWHYALDAEEKRFFTLAISQLLNVVSVTK